VQSASGEILRVFDARDSVVAASNNPKKGKSDTSTAMELVLKAHALKEAERELRELGLCGAVITGTMTFVETTGVKHG
jgi:hypothetical protein